MKDFQDASWPILRDCGFTAEVFVVADFVGRFADGTAAMGHLRS
jgi:hypothetical protein